ncbi:haloalkane dehalogenase [Streptomyces sp. NBC_01408]|uniref:haloalkane dehalogenase n=1 Tax=Streptomyces sp. NBC_01408 TaxID=2903855 RepID=UPI00225761B9|nr:haloalkane dehalogenase [Streptomyces sp. NBC_01408]MCX4696369.1 haloalkane dehalogenase [Streptomyces sp. NBC_01408]
MPTIDVLDSTMYYEDRDEGVRGVPYVFLHGNPTSSHLWRGVLPRIGGGVRVLAPDLIGMGRSGKPDGAYRFEDHARYLDAWFDALGLDEVVLVGQDWGGALAFDRAARHPGRVRGIAFMETILRPLTWEEYPPDARVRFEAIRTPGVGEEMVLDRNIFIEDSIGRTVLNPLGETDRAVYAAPYPTRESRLPMLQWARSLPIGGEPADVVARVEEYGAWLSASPEVPKLLLTFGGSPALMVGAATIAWCEENVAALETEYCGPAAHLCPEDRPEEIAAAVNAWAARHALAG